MKRSELTVKAMRDMGWIAVNDEPNIKDIVFNIQENEYWRYLKCEKDMSERYVTKEFGMCSTYEVKFVYEYLSVSADKVKWFKVAKRPVEISRYCTYAD